MNITTLGIDLAKNVFQLHGVDVRGKAVFKKTMSRGKLPEFVTTLSPCQIVMEACGGAHYWARQFKERGHEVKLISPQFVKPFVKTNKNDQCDAEAIVEAASRPSMRYVSPKTIEQQDMQSLLRMRESCIDIRTKLSNQMRGLLAEYGIVLEKKGLACLRKKIPTLYERDKTNGLTDFFKQLLETQYQLFIELDQQIAAHDLQIKNLAKTHETCQRIQAVEGIGPVTAVALTIAVGQPNDFKNGRHFAAYLGLVPRQHSSGGRDRLLGISKRGDSYTRQLLIHGARSAILAAQKKTDARSRWINGVCERRGVNRASVALANKNARIVLALVAHDEAYKTV